MKNPDYADYIEDSNPERNNFYKHYQSQPKVLDKMKLPHQMVTIDFNKENPKAIYSEFRKKLAQGASTESLDAVAHKYS